MQSALFGDKIQTLDKNGKFKTARDKAVQLNSRWEYNKSIHL